MQRLLAIAATCSTQSLAGSPFRETLVIAADCISSKRIFAASKLFRRPNHIRVA